MSNDIRAALERLVELDSTSITMRSKSSSLAWTDAIAAARAALAAEPVGEGAQRLLDAAVDARWYADLRHPATPPAPAPGEVGEELPSDGGYESGSMFTGHPLRPATCAAFGIALPHPQQEPQP